ncbi:hypothetical protein [Bacillus sp. V5-8f]|uniref:hypothetical protein n=1 Tax=Bacillus sp. V5-8f TaxID=2053044 RepID=UPI000C76833B|nr:hypothetical protein [Bacillus sp. V5-8f]PLT32074.1 hypothetical protein CUU64_21140 [Bacillus sp. V5-8f]
MNEKQLQQNLEIVSTIHRKINIITASLIITGQITILRMYIEPGGFGFTLGGPLTGRIRLEGKHGNEALSLILDIVDIILAILLLIDEIEVNGVFLSSGGGFSFNVTGPIFGGPKIDPTLPDISKVKETFHWIVSEHFNINPELIKQLQRNDIYGINRSPHFQTI